MLKRERYIAPVREFYDSNLIKLITGIRRCGKSVILGQIMREIQQKSDNHFSGGLFPFHAIYSVLRRKPSMPDLTWLRLPAFAHAKL